MASLFFFFWRREKDKEKRLDEHSRLSVPSHSNILFASTEYEV